MPQKCDTLSWEDVLAVADQALYASRFSGRNQWVGLAGTEQTLNDDFRDILVAGGELEVECEKGEPEDLEWND